MREHVGLGAEAYAEWRDAWADELQREQDKLTPDRLRLARFFHGVERFGDKDALDRNRVPVAPIYVTLANRLGESAELRGFLTGLLEILDREEANRG